MHSEYLLDTPQVRKPTKYDMTTLTLALDNGWRNDSEERILQVPDETNGVHTFHLPDASIRWTFVGTCVFPPRPEEPLGKIRYLFYTRRMQEAKTFYVFAENFAEAISQLYPPGEQNRQWDKPRNIRSYYDNETTTWIVWAQAGPRTGNWSQLIRFDVALGTDRLWHSHTNIGRGQHARKEEALRIAISRALRT